MCALLPARKGFSGLSTLISSLLGWPDLAKAKPAVSLTPTPIDIEDAA